MISTWHDFEYPGIPSDERENVSDDIILENIRNERNLRLVRCDWTQVADSPVDKAAWAAYRQELRDLPTSADPRDIVFPLEPQ